MSITSFIAYRSRTRTWTSLSRLSPPPRFPDSSSKLSSNLSNNFPPTLLEDVSRTRMRGSRRACHGNPHFRQMEFRKSPGPTAMGFPFSWKNHPSLLAAVYPSTRHFALYSICLPHERGKHGEREMKMDVLMSWNLWAPRERTSEEIQVPCCWGNVGNFLLKSTM